MRKNESMAWMYTKYFIIVFLFTVISQLLLNKTPSLFSKAKLLYNPDLTAKEVKRVNYLVKKEVTSSKDDTIAVFFYKDNFKSRSTFTTNSIVTNEVVTGITKDPEYSKALDYHKANLCYQQNLKDMNKSSDLFKAIESLNINLTEENGYYSSCPIIVKDKLVGYIGTFFTLDIPGRPSIRVNRLKFLSHKISNILYPYF